MNLGSAVEYAGENSGYLVVKVGEIEVGVVGTVGCILGLTCLRFAKARLILAAAPPPRVMSPYALRPTASRVVGPVRRLESLKRQDYIGRGPPRTTIFTPSI